MNTYPQINDLTYGIEVEFLSPHARDELVAAMNVELAEHGMRIKQASYQDRANRWRIKSDSSVSGRGLYGAELVSPILRGIDGLEELEIMLDVLNRFNPQINTTCGLHIHLGANTLNYDEVCVVMERYSEFESQIDSIMPSSRRGDNNNSYCGTVDSGYVARIKRGRKTKNNLAYNSSRWRKVNLDAITKHGTIEFRHHSGTTNFSKIVNWVSFLMTHVDVSRKLARSKRRQPAKARKTAFMDIKKMFTNKGWELKFQRGMAPTGRMNQWAAIAPNGVIETYLNPYALEACYVNGNFEQDEFFHRFSELSTQLVNANVVVEEEYEEIVDEGWLMDVDDNVVSYMRERQYELNN